MRDGSQYLGGLDDDRTVYLNGEAVSDIRSHPAFSGVAHSIARLYDESSDPEAAIGQPFGDSAALANVAFGIPGSVEDLRARRRASECWADLTQGFVGRAPDHVASFLAGFAASLETFDRDRPLAANVERFHRKAALEDLFVTYAIIPPQINRGAAAGDWSEDLFQVGVLEEVEEGIVVRGAQMLATAAAVADYVFVSCIRPLSAEEERHAISFVVPVGREGLKLYCRRPYAVGQPSDFDYPLSTRFDESDALLVFDDVLIPWEDVFVYRDPQGVRAQFFETPAHILGNSQAQVRLVAKTKFLAGIAASIAAINGIERIPAVQEKLGELASLVSIVEGMTLAAESACVEHASGAVVPNPRFLYGAMGMQAELYPRIVAIVRELAGGGVLQQPSSARELLSSQTREDMARYLGVDEENAEDRVKLFKLAWDAIGSEFGSRHLQYEMFYAGAPFVVKGYAYRNYGYPEVMSRVDGFLNGYSAADTPGPVAAAPGRAD